MPDAAQREGAGLVPGSGSASASGSLVFLSGHHHIRGRTAPFLSLPYQEMTCLGPHFLHARPPRGLLQTLPASGSVALPSNP